VSKQTKKIVITLLAFSAIATMTACQTVKGAGKDIEYAGEKTEDAIIKQQNK